MSTGQEFATYERLQQAERRARWLRWCEGFLVGALCGVGLCLVWGWVV